MIRKSVDIPTNSNIELRYRAHFNAHMMWRISVFLVIFFFTLANKGPYFGAQQSIGLLCAWVEFSFYRYFRLRVHLERGACAIVGVSTADLLLSQVKGLISFPLHSAQLRDTCLEFDSLQSVQKDQSRFRRSWKQTSMDDHRAPLRSGHLETAFTPDLHVPMWQP